MSLEGVEVRDAVLDEQRTQQLPAVVPQIEIRREDGVAEELAPFFVEIFALAIVPELGCQDRLDVLRLVREDETFPATVGLQRPRAPCLEEIAPRIQVGVIVSCFQQTIDEVKAFRGVSCFARL